MNEKSITIVKIFFALYFILYIFPFPLANLPYFCDNVVLWFGKNILNIESIEKIQVTGSGDTTFDYTKVLFLIIISTLLTVLLSFKKLEFKKNIIAFSISYSKYFLAYNMLSYGFAKINYGQFPFPDLVRLDEKIGDTSPMGLLWTFMGYSIVYSTFSAICEIIAGILLLFRKTIILGAIISFIITTNIVLLNFSYDVPVKLFSSHLMFISIFIIHQNIESIYTFFVGKESKISYYGFNSTNKWIMICKFVFIFIIIWSVLTPFYYRFSMSKVNSKSDLDAIYTNELFISNNDTIYTSNKWAKIIIDNNIASVYEDNGFATIYKLNIDQKKQTILFKSQLSSNLDFKLKYKLNSDKLELFGNYNSDKIYGIYNKKEKKDFELIKRNFNWISEYPYNR